MWQCAKCQRLFQKEKQSHICVVKDVGELFEGKPDELVLAWDALTQQVMSWQPNVYSAATHSIVYTSHKAWLIVKPMRALLDIKFYCAERLEDPLIVKTTAYGNKYAHHLRIAHEEELSPELFALLRQGYDYSIS